MTEEVTVDFNTLVVLVDEDGNRQETRRTLGPYILGPLDRIDVAVNFFEHTRKKDWHVVFSSLGTNLRSGTINITTEIPIRCARNVD